MSRTSRERVAQNFVNRFGTDGLSWLVDALCRGDSGQSIADHFEVSRERVRQWKNTFGQVVTLYQVHADVEALLVSPPSPDPVPSDRSGPGIYLLEDG